MKYSYYFLLFFIWCFFNSMDLTSGIEIKTFKDYYEANKDEYVDICWDFKNAQRVLIKGLQIDDQILKPKGCIGFIPEKSMTLNFLVINDNDTLKLASVINVKNINNEKIIKDSDSIKSLSNNEENDAKKRNSESGQTLNITKENNNDTEKIPQRGPIKFQKKHLDVSFEKSDYFSGLFKATKLTEPYKIKIVGSKENMLTNEIQLKVVVLDEFGNYLNGLNDIATNRWSLTFQNQNISKSLNKIKILEFNENLSDNIGILLDNSIAQFNREQLLSYINEFLYYQDEFDNVLLSVFNQNYKNIFDLSPMDKALWEFENFDLEQANGLNSLYKSLFIQLDQMHQYNPINPYIIVLTFNSDNSSVIYTADDVINLSKKYGIPIYIIGIGNAIDTYSLRYISLATGGSFYHIMDDEFSDILKALLEISHSRENHYKIITHFDGRNSCNSLLLKITLENSKKAISDYSKIIFESKLSFIPYQILANFEEQSYQIEAKYYEILDALVFVMKNNPEKKIQLIGHSDREGNESDNINLSKARALAIKDYLVQNGISEDNIYIKAEGFHKPLFFNTFKEWQKNYNRRVEVKWLDPSLKPYEIVLRDLYDNEYKATKITESFERSGYSSYYERYIFGNEIYYQIRLWGFASIPEAKTAAYKLQKSYNYKVYVE